MHAKDSLTVIWHKCHSVKYKINTSEILSIFGNTVKALRTERGLSQERLALEVGMDLTSINELEKGHRAPKLLTIIRLAYGLGVTPASLLENLSS